MCSLFLLHQFNERQHIPFHSFTHVFSIAVAGVATIAAAAAAVADVYIVHSIDSYIDAVCFVD